MSQSMLEERKLGQVSGEELISLLERSLNNSFQLSNSEAFSSISPLKRQLRPQKGPSYRKINRYFKSRKQYKKERDRRKQILQLYLVEYRTQKYIADKSGVSVSTVKRDLKKLRRYITGQTNRAIRQFQEEQRQRFEQRVEGLSLRERFDVLSAEMDRFRKLRSGANYRGHYTIFHLDMTQPGAYGIPKLTILPQQTRNKTWAFPHKVNVHIKGRYKDKVFEADLGGLTLRETRGW